MVFKIVSVLKYNYIFFEEVVNGDKLLQQNLTKTVEKQKESNYKLIKRKFKDSNDLHCYSECKNLKWWI